MLIDEKKFEKDRWYRLAKHIKGSKAEKLIRYVGVSKILYSNFKESYAYVFQYSPSGFLNIHPYNTSMIDESSVVPKKEIDQHLVYVSQIHSLFEEYFYG